MMTRVLYEKDETGIGVLTMNDPECLNAMGEEMAEDFREAVANVAHDKKDLRALILTGAGRAFSAGGNLDMLEAKHQLSHEENKKRMLHFYRSFLGVLELEVPLIAAMNGHAIGASMCLAAACDFRIAAEDAKLGFTFVRLGLHPGMAATLFVPRVVGKARAQELLLSGKIILGRKGERIGLVNEAVPAAEVLQRARAIAADLQTCGPLSVRQLLGSLRPSKEELESCLEREAELQSENYASKEFLEGVQATREKRVPKFSSC